MRPESLPTYQEMKWNDGIVYVEKDYPNLLFAKDGEIYNINGKKTLVIGGAYSVDRDYRIRMNPHLSLIHIFLLPSSASLESLQK